MFATTHAASTRAVPATLPPGPPPGPPPGRRQLPRPVVIGIVMTIIIGCFVFAREHEALADAGFGAGVANVTTDGFTHPWLGSYSTDVGTVWCIESGRAYPRASGNVPALDLPAARGVSENDRHALSYAVWAHGATGDPVTAAALAAVIHGLSGDEYASANVAAMAISDPAVKSTAVAIADEAQSRAFWVSDPWVDPWKITTTLTRTSATGWDAVTTVTTATGRAIADHRVGLVPYNVTDAPGSEHVRFTDAAGQIHSSWTQADVTRPIIIDAQTTAPTYYSVWKGPDYPLGSIPQRVITSNGTIYRGRGTGEVPTGSARVRKSTDNPAYQSALGATFDVIRPGVSTSLGTLTVGADGSSNALDLPVGDYIVTETWAPPGVRVDPTPYPLSVTEGATATLTLTDPVERHGGIRLAKVDVVTGEPVAGAQLKVERDDAGNGSWSDVGTFTSGLDPIALDNLAAGDYRITEVAPPAGYDLPDHATQDLSIDWDATALVTFADHRTIVVTTHAQLATDDAELPDAPPGLESSAHAVASLGHEVTDTVTVTGLAPGEDAQVDVALYGPTVPGSPAQCSPEHEVFADSWTATGPGSRTSAAFTPTTAGSYSWVATVSVPGMTPVSGPCGELSESAILTPIITTNAQGDASEPGAAVTDAITVTGLPPATEGSVHTALYGPFASLGALHEACTLGDLGPAVGQVDDAIRVTGPSMTFSSSPITLPSSADGVFSFIATLQAPGYPPISHPCGSAQETIGVAAPTTPTTTPPTTTTTTIPATTTPPTIPETTTTTSVVAPSSTTMPAPLESTTTTTTVTPTPPTVVLIPPVSITAPPTTSGTVRTPSTTATPPTTATTTTTTTASSPTTAEVPVESGGPTPGRTTGNGSTPGVAAPTPTLPATGMPSARLAVLGIILVVGGATITLRLARRRTTR